MGRSGGDRGALNAITDGRVSDRDGAQAVSIVEADADTLTGNRHARDHADCGVGDGTVADALLRRAPRRDPLRSGARPLAEDELCGRQHDGDGYSGGGRWYVSL